MPLPRPSALGFISSLVQEVTDRMEVTATIKISNVFFISLDLRLKCFVLTGQISQ